MGVLNWFKKPKYDRSKEEVDQIIEQAVIPEHAKQKTENALTEKTQKTGKKTETIKNVHRVEPNPILVIPTEKNIFFVENSFKMLENYILNGYVRSGLIKRNMRTVFDDETLLVKGLQLNLRKTTRLEQGERGTLEVKTRRAFHVPDNTELEFGIRIKTLKRKRKKNAFAKTRPVPRKTSPKPPVLAGAPEALEEIAQDVLREETGQTNRQ